MASRYSSKRQYANELDCLFIYCENKISLKPVKKLLSHFLMIGEGGRETETDRQTDRHRQTGYLYRNSLSTK